MAALDLMAILRNAGVNLDAPAPSSGSSDQNAKQAADTGQQHQQPPQSGANSKPSGPDAAPAGETAEAAANISDQLMSLVGMLSTGAINGS